MKIRLTRSRRGPVLTCLRQDGTCTHSVSRFGEFFAIHDLMHYAVETTLGLGDSFYGLVARGRQIPDFGQPGAAKALGLPTEAGQTEFIVAQLDLAARDVGYGGLARLDAGVVNAMVRQSCENAGAGVPRELTQAELGAIGALMEELVGRWRRLPEGESMDMEFRVGEGT